MARRAWVVAGALVGALGGAAGPAHANARVECTPRVTTGGIRLELGAFGGRPGAGTLRIVNGTNASQRFWRAGNSWGDRFAFRAQAGGVAVTVRWMGAYSANVAWAIDVPAGCAYAVPFDFAREPWQSSVPFAQWVGRGATLSAVYEIPADAESARQHVWTGALQSAPVPWQP